MRTMMIANSLVANGAPTAKGGLGFLNTLGNAIDMTTSPIVSPAITDRNGMIQIVNALGNGSVKTFTINPFHFDFHSQLSGTSGGNAVSDITPKHTITYPVGSGYAKTDSFGMQFEGGIVVKKLDTDKNVYNTKKILNVEVIGTAGQVLVSDVVTAFKAAMETLISNGTTKLAKDYPIASRTHTSTTSSEFVLNSNDWFIELVGDLRWFNMPKVEGVSYVNTGVDAAKFERELASNDGFHHSELDVDLYAKSNFIADTASNVVYDIITITTKANAQRPLLPNAAGFDKQLYIYVLHTAVASYNKILAYLGALKTANGGAVSI